jgi:hypothetical protein
VIFPAPLPSRFISIDAIEKRLICVGRYVLQLILGDNPQESIVDSIHE